MDGQRAVRKIFLDWQVLLSLGLLLVNDIWWKYEYSNFLTGKLSDVAGLFMVGAILARSQPHVANRWLVGIGVTFCLWKSPLSQPLIDIFNALSPYAIGRVVDYSDLFALAVLPLAHPRFQTCLLRTFHAPRIELAASWLAGSVVLLAMMGTSALPLRDDFAFRKPTGEEVMTRAAVSELVDRVATRHGLTLCDADIVEYVDVRYCQDAEKNGLWDLWLGYSVSPEKSKVDVTINGRPGGPISLFGSSGDTEAIKEIRNDLIIAFRKRFGDLEFVLEVNDESWRPLPLVE